MIERTTIICSIRGLVDQFKTGSLQEISGKESVERNRI